MHTGIQIKMKKKCEFCEATILQSISILSMLIDINDVRVYVYDVFLKWFDPSNLIP